MGAEGVRLADQGSRVDLVVHHHQDALAAGGRIDRGQPRRLQVGRAVRTGLIEPPHGARQRHGRVVRDGQGQGEGGLLQGVGAVGDDDPVGRLPPR